MHRLKWVFFVVAILAVGVLAACSGGSDSADTESLRSRVEKAYADLGGGNWLAFYSYTSPRFRELCKSGEYVLWQDVTEAFFEGFMGLEDDTEFHFRLTGAVSTGDEGLVFASLLVDENGELLEFGDSDGERWVFADGRWWQEDTDWEKGCSR